MLHTQLRQSGLDLETDYLAVVFGVDFR